MPAHCCPGNGPRRCRQCPGSPRGSAARPAANGHEALRRGRHPAPALEKTAGCGTHGPPPADSSTRPGCRPKAPTHRPPREKTAAAYRSMLTHQLRPATHPWTGQKSAANRAAGQRSVQRCARRRGGPHEPCLYTARWPHRQATTQFMCRRHLSGDRDRGFHSRPADPPAGCVGRYRDWMAAPSPKSRPTPPGTRGSGLSDGIPPRATRDPPRTPARTREGAPTGRWAM